MTKQSKEIRRMIRNAANVAIARAERLQKCGGVDPESPYFCKAIVCAALKDAALDYMPLTPEGKAEVKNLALYNAAPDLLAACKLLVGCQNYAMNRDDGLAVPSYELRAAITEAQTAIAKAEKGTQ